MIVQQKNLPMQLAREPLAQSSPWYSVLHFLMLRAVLPQGQLSGDKLYVWDTYFSPIARGTTSSLSNSLLGCSFPLPEMSSL